MAYTKVSKPLSSYISVDKFGQYYLLFQTQDMALYQDGGEIIIFNKPEDNYTKVEKT